VRSAIRRRQYAGDLARTSAEQAVSSLDVESRRVVQHPVTSPVLATATALVDRQNLRALDSIQLATAMVARDAQNQANEVLFVSSDQRLLEAAASEGFSVWDPTTGPLTIA
jgi:predicted nucleic acid-binding protein